MLPRSTTLNGEIVNSEMSQSGDKAMPKYDFTTVIHDDVYIKIYNVLEDRTIITINPQPEQTSEAEKLAMAIIDIIENEEGITYV